MRTIELLAIGFVGLLFIVTFASGAWLAYSGRPYSDLIVNSHKILSLLTVVVTGATIYLLVSR